MTNLEKWLAAKDRLFYFQEKEIEGRKWRFECGNSWGYSLYREVRTEDLYCGQGDGIDWIILSPAEKIVCVFYGCACGCGCGGRESEDEIKHVFAHFHTKEGDDD